MFSPLKSLYTNYLFEFQLGICWRYSGPLGKARKSHVTANGFIHDKHFSFFNLFMKYWIYLNFLQSCMICVNKNNTFQFNFIRLWMLSSCIFYLWSDRWRFEHIQVSNFLSTRNMYGENMYSQLCTIVRTKVCNIFTEFLTQKKKNKSIFLLSLGIQSMGA